MGKIKVYIESNLIPLTEVTPVIAGDFEYSREKDAIYYKHEAKDVFKFEKKDWDLLKPQISEECSEVTITVEKLCRGKYKYYWAGVFTIKGSTVNYDKCFIKVSPKALDTYKCLEDGLKEEQNIYSSGSVITVTSIGGTLEVVTCDQFIEQSMWGGTPYSGCLTNPSNWCMKSDTVETLDADGTTYIDQTTVWHRELITVPCVGGVATAPPFGSGWSLVSDDCSGSNTSTWWRCPPNNNGVVVGDYTRGRTLGGVIDRILTNLNCGLTIKSDFFNLNAVGDAPNNSAYTYATNNLHNLTVHQKSDIKRKNDSNGSTSAAWEIKAGDFFDDLRKIFNVYYEIIDGVLILEHYSYFTTSLGLDLTNASMTKEVNYGGNDNVKTEKRYWAEDISSYEFKATNLTYDCGEEELEIRCSLFTTDIVYTENEANESKISDEGFMLIANYDFNGNLIIIDNNDPLKWSNLLPSLHTYGRLYKSGKINGLQMDFDSWFPYIKQVPFKIDLCCNEVFEPQNLITTSLGDGAVTNAIHNVYTDKLEIELSY